jgi:hypothetical protein
LLHRCFCFGFIWTFFPILPCQHEHVNEADGACELIASRLKISRTRHFGRVVVACVKDCEALDERVSYGQDDDYGGSVYEQVSEVVFDVIHQISLRNGEVSLNRIILALHHLHT